MKLEWDQTGERLFELGVKKGVLYPMVNGAYPKGVAWNGLSSVTETPSGGEPTAIYADDIKYLNIISPEETGGTIEAYMYPPEFAECDGSKAAVDGVYVGQQTRKTFGLCYRTVIGNDTEGIEYGYKLHLVWGCLAAPSERTYSSINESAEPEPMSWEYTTTPVAVDGFKATASIVIDSTKCDAEALAALETILYGSGESDSGTDARLPLPDEVLSTLGYTTAS